MSSLLIPPVNSNICLFLLDAWRAPQFMIQAANKLMSDERPIEPPTSPEEALILEDIRSLEGELSSIILMSQLNSKSLKLNKLQQQLFRLAYIVDSSPLLVFVARQVARLHTSDANAFPKSAQLAECIADLLLPVLQILGLWELRRDIANTCLRITSPKIYNARIQEIATADELHQHSRGVIEDQLVALLRELGISARVKSRHLTPHSVERRWALGASVEAIVNQLRFTILVEVERECAQVAQRVAKLWTPLSQKSSVCLLQSAVASPKKFNGYQAEVLCFDYINPLNRTSQTTIEVQICSESAAMINRLGIVATRYIDSDLAVNGLTWWHPAKYSNIREIVKNFPVGSRNSEPSIYVFSPLGQLYLLPIGSTALDFAYAVHREIGNHCVSIQVNRHAIDLSERLVCGSIVRVETDRSSPGPKEEWLSIVRTPSARREIKRVLKDRLSPATRGRMFFDSRLDEYQRKHGLMELPASEVDRFLQLTAAMLAFQNVKQLFVELSASRHDIKAKELVNRLIAQQLVPNIVTEKGESLTHPLPRIRFMPGVTEHGKRIYVRPGQPIVGKWLPSPNGPMGRLLISPQETSPRFERTGGDKVALMWKLVHSEQKAFRLTIETFDQPMLLESVLKIIYSLYDKGLYIQSFAANARADESVEIDCMLTSRDFATIQQLVDKLSASDTLSVTLSKLSPVEIAMLQPRADLPNPYTKSPLTGRLLKWFFGRQDDVREITAACKNSSLVIVTGPTGIGKTSLFHFLRSHLVRQQPPDAQAYLPILVEGIRKFSEDGFWTAIWQGLVAASPAESNARRVAPDVKYGLSAYEIFQDEFTHFSEHHAEIRPIFIIDEFSHIDTEEWPDEEARVVIQQLHGLVEMPNGPIIILGIHAPTSAFRNGPRTSSLRLAAVLHQLGELSRNGARKLITEPVAGSAEFSHDAIQRLLDLSGCYPYYLQSLLSELFKDFQSFRSSKQFRVGIDEVNQIAQTLVTRRGKFEPLYFSAPVVRLGVLESIAWSTSDGENPVTLPEILNNAEPSLYDDSGYQLRRDLQTLIDLGVLKRHDDKGKPRYAFTVPLFGKWLIHRYPNPKANYYPIEGKL